MQEAAATFHSILGDKDGVSHETPGQPDFFPDLNLDQVIEAATSAKQEYDLKPFFWTPLRDPETVRYRQEVFRDLEDESLMVHIRNGGHPGQVFLRSSELTMRASWVIMRMSV